MTTDTTPGRRIGRARPGAGAGRRARPPPLPHDLGRSGPGLARRDGRVPRVRRRRLHLRVGARPVGPHRRVVLRRRRARARRLADRCRQRDRPHRVRVDADRHRDRVLVGADRVQALAPPVHVPRQHRGPRDHRRASLYEAFSGPGRTTSRSSGAGPGFSLPAAAGRSCSRSSASASPTRSSCAGGPGRSPRSIAAVVVAVFVAAGSTSASTTRSTSRAGVVVGRRHHRQRLPLLHAQRGLPGHLPAGQDRPPRRRRAPGRGDPQAVAGPARPHRGRHQAGRPGRLGRLDAAAAAGGRRPRHVPVREALRDEPRAVRPLVQARPHHPLRAPGGRGAVPVGAPARRVRGLHAAAPARRRHPDRRRPTASSR